MAGAPRLRARHQGLLPRREGPEPRRALAASTSSRPARLRCAAWAPTSSTSTRSTAGTMRPRSRRRWTRSTRSSARARCATWARAAWRPGSSRRRSTRRTRRGWQRFVSMQNHYNLAYREEEREMIPLCVERGRGPRALEPAGPRLPRRLAHARGGEGRRPARSPTTSPTRCTSSRGDFDVLDAVVAVAGERASSRPRWRWPGCLAARGGRAHRGRDAPRASRRRGGRRRSARSPTRRSARLEAPYGPHAVLGHEQPTPREVAARVGRLVS